jgi:fructokinase
MKAQTRWGFGQCDILKISEDELAFLYGCPAIEDGARRLRAEFPNIRILFVTKGEYGAECFFQDLHVSAPAFLNKKTIDTTGAGDTFLGCCLDFLLDCGLESITEPKLNKALRYANAAASLITTRKGAFLVMPGREEIEKLAGLY